MYTKQPKKTSILNILEILRRYSDSEHRLSQKEIAALLEREYDMRVDRKAIKRNLMNLIDFGYEIEYSETERKTVNSKTGEEEDALGMTDFYLCREFDDSELRLLIDSLLFSRHLPYGQCKALIEKIEGLSSVYFRSRVSHISTLPRDKTDNRQIFLNIELLDEAIRQNRKVSFKYTEYGADKKSHPKKGADGNERIYTVSPYQMVAKEGKYFLICNYDRYDDISNYRLDRICDLEILKEKARPFSSLAGAKGQPLDLGEYMKEHVYMFAGETVRAEFWVTKAMIGEVVDLFGQDVTFFDEDEKGIVAAATANEMSVEQFAKIYAPDVIVLSPEKTVERLRDCLRETLANYTACDTPEKPIDRTQDAPQREDPRRETLVMRWQAVVRQFQEEKTLDMPDARALFAETWRYWIDRMNGGGIDNADLPMLGAMYSFVGQNEYPEGVKPWEFDAYSKLVKALLSALEDPFARNGYDGSFLEGYITVEEWARCGKAVNVKEFDRYFDELAGIYYEDGYMDSYEKDGTCLDDTQA